MSAAMLLQVFGNSPDETANCRLYLNRESTIEALTMIQPQLMAFAYTEAGYRPYPVRRSLLWIPLAQIWDEVAVMLIAFGPGLRLWGLD